MKNKILFCTFFCCVFPALSALPDSSCGTRFFSSAFTNATETLKIKLLAGREQRRTNAIQKVWTMGELTSWLTDFCQKCPEERFVWESVRLPSGGFAYKTNGIVRGKLKERVEKFTEAEVAEGRICNAAARKAVLDYFLDSLASGDEYEQMEVSTFVFHTWDEGGGLLNRHFRDEDGMTNLNTVLQRKVQDKNLAASTRIRAACYLASDTDYDPGPVLRDIVTNLPPAKPSNELVRSLQRIAHFVPDAAKKLKDIEAAETEKAQSGKDANVE